MIYEEVTLQNSDDSFIRLVLLICAQMDVEVPCSGHFKPVKELRKKKKKKYSRKECGLIEKVCLQGFKSKSNNITIKTFITT